MAPVGTTHVKQFPGGHWFLRDVQAENFDTVRATVWDEKAGRWGADVSHFMAKGLITIEVFSLLAEIDPIWTE